MRTKLEAQVCRKCKRYLQSGKEEQYGICIDCFDEDPRLEEVKENGN